MSKSICVESDMTHYMYQSVPNWLRAVAAKHGDAAAKMCGDELVRRGVTFGPDQVGKVTEILAYALEELHLIE